MNANRVKGERERERKEGAKEGREDLPIKFSH